MKPITEAQKCTLAAFAHIEGWATYKQLRFHGGNTSSCAALVRAGMVAHREEGAAEPGWGHNEWRITKQGLKELASCLIAECGTTIRSDGWFRAMSFIAPKGNVEVAE